MPPSRMRQLEEVNRATSPQEYLVKLERWSKDRGMPGVDEPFSFTVVMQYCEKLEEQHRQDVGLLVRTLKILDWVEELAKSPLQQLLYACFVRRWWGPGRPIERPGK